jgi:alkylation response protein AidB-like acyl-CoA dehydrogenase
MDFELSEDQQLLMTSLESLVERYRTLRTGPPGYVAFSEQLQAELVESGFLEIARQEGFGALEAALLIEAVAHCPAGAEVAASALIGPLLGAADSPIALAWRLGEPARYLPHARTVCFLDGDEVLVGTPAEADVRPVNSTVAYPLAVLESTPAGAARITGEAAAAIRRRALIGIAAEAAGLMRGAIDNTVRYVRERRQFGQPLGHFQAIQHRLAEDATLVRACRSLAFRAAYLDDDRSAAVACLHAQEAMRKVVYDCHQFSGAMGLTLEFPLHLWTYRLKFLQGEAGGRGAQAALLARHVWDTPGKKASGLSPVRETTQVLG